MERLREMVHKNPNNRIYRSEASSTQRLLVYSSLITLYTRALCDVYISTPKGRQLVELYISCCPTWFKWASQV